MFLVVNIPMQLLHKISEIISPSSTHWVCIEFSQPLLQKIEFFDVNGSPDGKH